MAADSSKQSILIVHNYYQIPGGEDTVVANEKKMLESHGHKVVLYSRSNSELKEMSVLGKLALPLTAIFNPRTYKDVRKIIAEQDIKIVHVHNTLHLVSPAVYYAALSMKVPIVQTVHNFRLICPGATFYRDGHICEDCIEHGLRCAIKHRCYRGSLSQTLVCVLSMKIHRLLRIYGRLNYICLTGFNKEKLLNLKQIREDRVFIKPNFTFNFEAKGDAGCSGGFYLYIGRIEEMKGIPLLIEAFSKMPEKKLVLAGTGTEIKHYQEILEKRKIQNIEFAGFMEKDGLARLLKGAKAVIAAPQWYEGFPMVIMEAYSIGTPVIVGNIGNISDLVEDGINGIKFSYDSPDALVEAVGRFEKMDIRRLGENAYRKFLEKYAADRNYETLKHIYGDIFGGVKD